MPLLRSALALLRDPVFANLLALHAGAALAALMARRWLGPARA